MQPPTIEPANEPDWISEQINAHVLQGWSGLRLYLRQRRAGAPEDATMETLLREVLRTRLPRGTDIPGMVARLEGRAGV